MAKTKRAMVFSIAMALAACSPAMHSFPLPQNVSVAPPDPRLSPQLAALSGAWRGTWLTPGWGPGYECLLVVERIDGDEATVLYAWGHHTWLRDTGWYRQKAQILAGHALEWTRGTSNFTFQLSSDRKELSGVVKTDVPETAYIVMKQVPFEAPGKPAAAPARAPGPALPALPSLLIVPPAADLPPAVDGFLGVWEGIWDSGVLSRLVVWAINRATAMVVYAWSDDPAGGFKADFMKRVAVVYEDQRKIAWGSQPKFTFRLGAGGQTLEGEWEREGQVSSVIMRKVTQTTRVE